MTPAVGAIVFIENRNGMRRLCMLNELSGGILAGEKTRRTLDRVNAADQVEGINNQQVYCHKQVIKIHKIRATYVAPGTVSEMQPEWCQAQIS
jgi:hypothetical protein